MSSLPVAGKRKHGTSGQSLGIKTLLPKCHNYAIWSLAFTHVYWNLNNCCTHLKWKAIPSKMNSRLIQIQIYWHNSKV